MTDVMDGPEIVEVDEKGNVIEIGEAFKRKRGVVDDDDTKTVYSDELIQACRDIGILESAIREGGDYRQAGDKKIYWLPLQELLEFEQKDIETSDDDEFWGWFDDLIVNRALKTKWERTQKKQRSWSEWKPRQWDDWKPQKMGSWWSNWGYSTSGGSGTELTRRLAVALKAITTTVSVVNTTGKRYRVKLAADTPEQPSSYTSYNEQLIAISPQALLDTSIDSDLGVEITTGYGLHEASHVQYSESLLKALTQPTELTPKSIAGLMHNILEDLRIEHLTGEKFPGFVEVGYVKGVEPIRFGVIRALERLAEDPQTKQEMDDLSKAEAEAEKKNGKPLNDQQFADLMKKLKELLDKGGATIDPCPSPGTQPQTGQPGQPGQTVTLTDAQAQELEKLISEQYQQFEAFYKMQEGQHGVSPVIEVNKPSETPDSKAAYRKPGPMVERLRSVFFFRKKLATESERLLRNGFVDEEELWRAGTGDPRVFERSSVPEETNTSVTMLVDVSGSMVGSGLEKAQELANVMMACLRTQRGVRTRVRAHSTGHLPASGQTCRIYRIWEPGDPDTRIGLLNQVQHGSNFDGFAIDWCAKELNDTAQVGEEKLLIVLSDGLPAGSIHDDKLGGVHYGGVAAMKHMHDLGEHWLRKGVTIVQVAIDADDIRPEDQAAMFRYWIGYESDGKLLTDLTTLLSRTFGGVE